MTILVKRHPLKLIYLVVSEAPILAGSNASYQLTVSDVANALVAVGTAAQQ